MRRLCLILVIAFLMSACGKKGPLIYPDQLVPESPTAVTVRQTGLGMKLSFLLPQKDRAGRPLGNLAGVRILKRESLPGQECSACTDTFQLFKKVYVDFQDESVRRYGSLMMVLDSDVTVARSYSYTFVPFTKGEVDGQGSASATATLEQPPLPPTLHVISLPTEIKLEFGGRPPAVGTRVGYNLYRTAKGETMPFLPLNKEPMTGNGYTDSGLDRRATYLYAVRILVRMPTTGEVVESAFSNQVEGALKDEE